jgi:hypothetical protein
VSDDRHPVICYDLDIVQRFFRTVASAVTLARFNAPKGQGRVTGRRIPIGPVLFFWEDDRDDAEEALPREFVADVDEMHRTLVFGWIDELARSGPKAAARFVDLARSQRGSAHAAILSGGRAGGGRAQGGDVIGAIAALDRFAPGGTVGITAYPAHVGVVHGAGAATGLAVSAIDAPPPAQGGAFGAAARADQSAPPPSWGRTGPAMPEGFEPPGARAGHEEEPAGGRLGFQHVPPAMTIGGGGPAQAAAHGRPFALAWEEGAQAMAAAIHVSAVTGTGGTTGAAAGGPAMAGGAAAMPAVFGAQGPGAAAHLGRRAFAEAERARIVLSACDDLVHRHSEARGQEAMQRRARHGSEEILRRTSGVAGPASARPSAPFPMHSPGPGPQMPVVWVGWDLVDRARSGEEAMAGAR